MIIVDTNVVSDLMRGGTPQVLAWLSTVAGEDLYTTVITRSEIRYGIARLPQGKRRDDLDRRASAFLDEVADRTLRLDVAAADRYGFVVAERESAGRPIPRSDAQIASIAYVHRATVATRNTRDFEGCGISLIDPFVFGDPA
ncbi:type II toxin-antitoxin system VapC family toxin [Aeromicrobium stalagmiti]|uniref:type II toxin-antitoxin system VapC family toxin n=1 Tax=Aeromicrobium stalagmiti TaxID=2738988 RepID=UPI001569F509|nr:type II toxin-antitoxin system VapC family toxin [Aeromicrobium stalagmiti]